MIRVGALLIALALVVGVCCIGYVSRNVDGKWFSNGDMKSWHWVDKGNEELPSDSGNVDNGEFKEGGAIVSDTVANGISFYSAEIPRAAFEANGISAQAESAMLITAEVSPKNVINKEINVSYGFKNPNSTWAKGKTLSDYVVFDKIYVDSELRLTVTCLQAFGEQIVVVFTSQADSSKFATCTIDFAQRFDIEYIRIGDMEDAVFNEEGVATMKMPKFIVDRTGGAGGYLLGSFSTSDTYTIGNNGCQLSVKVKGDPQFPLDYRPNSDGEYEYIYAIYEPDKYGERDRELYYADKIYFDLRFFEMFQYVCESRDLNIAEYLSSAIENETSVSIFSWCLNKPFMTLEVTGTNGYYTQTKTVDLVWGGYTIPVKSVDTSGSIVL